jgi:2-methylisocitrate lyase-like PEP mutase family enzyme
MTTRLKALFQRPALFVLAGGINPIGAKMAEALGYEAFYMSGGNTSAHQLGWPDSGTSMRDMVDNARKIVLTVQIPVFADADTGYGDAINTYYTVREYIQAGIAGAHIEDQTFPPKAGPRPPPRARGKGRVERTPPVGRERLGIPGITFPCALS